MVSNASCPRILTNREARWGSALAVFGATDQSEITVPSGSSVTLLGVKDAISGQRLVIHAFQKTARCFQSARPRINSSLSSFVKGHACFVSDRAAILRDPTITMSSGVEFISTMDRSILACCRRVDGATSNIATKKAAQLSSFIGCSCVRQKVVNCPTSDILGSFIGSAHISQAYSFALLIWPAKSGDVGASSYHSRASLADKLHCPSRRLRRAI
ncbi:hypothetical protein TcG_01246 [Trypanosoma cruzi]|nr:hypothetical protein TcG_01246 [Trypanosoma cruzi]